MSVDSTREMLQGYANALLSFGDFARYMAEDVTVTFMGTDRSVNGVYAARQLITFVHQVAFKTAIQIKGAAYGDGYAMLEAEFIGTHIAEFEGIAPTNRHVRVPYSAAYDVVGNQITALRLYFPLDLLLQQIGGVRDHVSAAV